MDIQLFEKQCDQVRKICGPDGWDLYNNSTADKQAMYMLAEAGELALSVAKEDYSETGLMDDVGDVLVTIVNYCAAKGIDFSAAHAELAQADIKSNEFYSDCPYDLVSWLVEFLSNHQDIQSLGVLMRICEVAELDINECFQLAIDTISKRTGSYVNGVFVKDQ